MLSDPVLKSSSIKQDSFFIKDVAGTSTNKNVEITHADAFISGSTEKNKLIDGLQILRQALTSSSPDLLTIQKANSSLLDNPQQSIAGLSATQIPQLKNTLAEIEQMLKSSGNIPASIIDSTLKTIDKINSLLPTITLKADTASFMIPQSQNNQEGLYTYSSLDEAVQSLGLTEKDQDIKELLASALQRDGEIILKVTGNTDGFIGTLLSPKNAYQELQSFFKSLSSSILQSLPPETLLSLFNSRNELSFDVIRNIDSLLSGTSIQFPGERAGSQSAATAVATQWINTIIDNKSLQNDPTTHLPLSSAAKLITELNSINETISKTTPDNLKPLVQTGITEEQLNTLKKNDILPFAIRNSGYTLESTILNDDRNRSTPDLKAQLLNLNRQVQEIQSTPSNLMQRVEANTSDLEVIGNQLIKKSDQAVPVKTMLSELSAIITDNQKSLTTTGSNLQSDINPEKSIISPNKAEQLLNSILKVIEPVVNQQTITPLTKDQLQQGVNLLQFLTKAQADPLIPQELKKQFSEVIDQLSNWLSRNTVSDKHSHLTGKDLQHAQNPVVESDRALSPQTSLRQTIETSLGRLESLQLLARQVPVPEGQQQVIALPIKIGAEWTEVNLRFLKKNKSSKKKQSEAGNYSVFLNVEPRQLGSISVKMDYIQKKSLKISMNFENISTKNYFQKSIDDIKLALKDLGLPISTIEMRTKKVESEHQESTPLNVTIDLKV